MIVFDPQAQQTRRKRLTPSHAASHAKGIIFGRSRPPLARMLIIHNLLLYNKFPNRRNLSERLAVSSKTIERDICFMRDQLVLPIEYDSKKHGFFYTGKVTQFPTLQITEREFLALKLLYHTSFSASHGLLHESAASALRKLAAIVNNENNDHTNEKSRNDSFVSSPKHLEKKLLMDSFGSVINSGRYQIRIWFDKVGAVRARELQWQSSSKISPLQNGEIEMEMKMNLEGLTKLQVWLLGLGKHARVLCPQILIDRMREDVFTLAHYYLPP